MNACFSELGALFASPRDGAALALRDSAFVGAPGERYAVEGNIADFYVPDADGAEAAKPSPITGYEGIDGREQLRRAARKSTFARLLDEQIPRGSLVLDAGCGTGQLTNFLAMSPWRRVVGGDSLGSPLALAEDFRSRFEINNAAFVRMNTLRMPFKLASFDIVVAGGALQHARDAKAAFRCLVGKLKPGGFVIVRLRNGYARAATLVRRMSGGGIADPDQTGHSADDVLRWFAAEGIDFVSAIPRLDGRATDSDASLFQPQPAASGPRRALSQLGMLLERSGEGGLFVMVGRRKA